MSNKYSKTKKLIRARVQPCANHSTLGLTLTVAPTSTHVSYRPAVATGTLTTVYIYKKLSHISWETSISSSYDVYCTLNQESELEVNIGNDVNLRPAVANKFFL